MENNTNLADIPRHTKIQNIKATEIKFDRANYQRILEARYKRIAKEWSWAIYNRPKLSQRTDGTYWAMDGQHTIMAAIEKFGEEVFLECEVFTGLSIEDEANFFFKLNTSSKKPTYNERLKARIASGDKEAIEYDKALKESGVKYHYSSSGSNQRIVCHSALMTAFRKYDHNLFVEALKLAAEIWGGEYENYRADSLSGLFKFLDAYKGEIDTSRFAKKMKAVPFVDIVKMAKSFSPSSNNIGQNSGRYYAMAYAEVYNKGLRAANKLSKIKL